MKLIVRGKNIEVTEALKDYAERKISKIDKYFAYETEAQAALSVERGMHKIEVTVLINGMILRAEVATGDMYASIDQVVDKLERQIAKYKTRINRKARQGGSLKAMHDLPAVEEEEDLLVVKTKRFVVKPMPVEEAILQMNLLGHDFFVFVNAENNDEINVVYRRRDGKYGLIEPALK
ncbi:MAG TPA: ribosome-associated translation inhibitor RaiA [Firmicutes bacterium]|jgi:putative sigma-54 modulation protein|nr:ribosome-associated translation inhibitor RaiA [Bacillota bacterium]HAA37717.1 ribosome-associated translation inhibitor RaiA [Bacillota bacterium]